MMNGLSLFDTVFRKMRYLSVLLFLRLRDCIINIENLLRLQRKTACLAAALVLSYKERALYSA